MKLLTPFIATAMLATIGATTVVYAEGTPKSAPTGQNMNNNSGTKTPDEQDTTKRSMAPATGQKAPAAPAAARTSGSGAAVGTTNTDLGRANPDEQDISRGKGPSTPKPPVGSR